MAKKKQSYPNRALTTVRKFFPHVKKVQDATNGLSIHVAASDNKNALVKSHKACAAAVACKREHHLDGVIISRAIAYTVKGDVATRYVVPGSLSREVVSFDRGGGFEPGEYRLGRPDPHIQLGVERAPHIPDPSGKSKRVVHITTNIRTVLGGRKK